MPVGANRICNNHNAFSITGGVPVGGARRREPDLSITGGVPVGGARRREPDLSITGSQYNRMIVNVQRRVCKYNEQLVGEPVCGL